MTAAKATAIAAAVTVTAAGAVGAVVMAASDGPAKAPQDPPATFVTRVVDGDTVEIGSGAVVRLIGIDTPESGECGYQSATDALRRLVEGMSVTLLNPASVQDEDKYGRLLRYVDRLATDTGYQLIAAGLAAARYDSRDGYDPHPREGRYRAAAGDVTSRCEKKKQVQQDQQAQQEQRRHAEEVAAAAGITAVEGEGARHLLARAQAQLRETRLAHARHLRQVERRQLDRQQERQQKRQIEQRLERQAERQHDQQQAPPLEPGSDDGGYTGCRAYDPGGITWTPIPC